MDLAAFRDTLEHSGPPPCGPALQALWHEARGDWERAHDLTNEAPGQDGAWVHAYLHRVEGDLSNADYWYARAERSRPDGTTALEWEAIVSALLEQKV